MDARRIKTNAIGSEDRRWPGLHQQGIELPFGGMKHSGYGREKGFEGLRSFTQLKTVAIRH
jgi:acyl-CoA reductase-like NAD-dependent aldehyde dehydrogenase